MIYSLLKRLRMESLCIEIRTLDKHTQEGLRILARIIARDFIAKKAFNGDCKNENSEYEHLQDK